MALSDGGTWWCAHGEPHSQVNHGWQENREWVHEMQRSTWHNRLDIMTLVGGVVGGVFLTRSRVWTGLLGFTQAQASIRGGGVAWGAFFGTAFDLPLCRGTGILKAVGFFVTSAVRVLTR